jgi:hypothetical protein
VSPLERRNNMDADSEKEEEKERSLQELLEKHIGCTSSSSLFEDVFLKPTVAPVSRELSSYGMDNNTEEQTSKGPKKMSLKALLGVDK